MTEHEWLSAKTVLHLDLWRSAKNQHRKWRLFAVACCRRAMKLAADARVEAVADAAERFADGDIGWIEVKQSRKVLAVVRRGIGDPYGKNEVLRHTIEALDNSTQQKPVGVLGANDKAEAAFAYRNRLNYSSDVARLSDFDRCRAAEAREQLVLARDIFGNPFRPVAFSPAWRSESAVSLARMMYDTRIFHVMPVLADALEEAGCDHPDVLAHCREPNGVHVRGCWVVDLVLGKS